MRRINSGEEWRAIFPGVATLRIDPDADGPGLSLRITRNKGEAVQLVADESPDAKVMAVKRVNELDFYSMGLRDLAKKLQVTEPKLLALVEADRVQENADFFKLVKIGRTELKRYSPKAFDHLHKRLSDVDLQQLWQSRKSSSVPRRQHRSAVEIHGEARIRSGMRAR